MKAKMAAARAPLERPVRAAAFLDFAVLGLESEEVALVLELELPVTAAAADLDSFLASLDEDLACLDSDLSSDFEAFDSDLLSDLSVALLSLITVVVASSRLTK